MEELRGLLLFEQIVSFGQLESCLEDLEIQGAFEDLISDDSSDRFCNLNIPGTKLELNDWKKLALDRQKSISYQFSDRTWDAFSLPTELQFLERKISFPIFGATDQLNKDDEKTVSEIVEKIKQYCCRKDRICMAVIIVSGLVNSTYFEKPVFRVLTNEMLPVQSNKFIDEFGRVYNSWKHFESDNTYAECWLCVPMNGHYVNETRFDFLNQSDRSLLSYVDKGANVANVSSTISLFVGGALTLFPPTAPVGGMILMGSTVIGGVSGGYSCGRTVHKLYDRHSHEQSVSLMNQEARACWGNVAGGIASVGAAGATKFLQTAAKSGRVVSSFVRNVCTGIKVSPLVVSGATTAENVYHFLNKEEKNSVDCLNLTLSCLLFAHSAMTFQTATSVIKEAQELHINKEYLDPLSGRNQKSAKVYWERRKMMAGDEVKGNAEFIKEMGTIDNKNKFFRGIFVTPKSKILISKNVKAQFSNDVIIKMNKCSSALKTKNFGQPSTTFVGEFLGHITAEKKSVIAMIKNLLTVYEYEINRVCNFNIDELSNREAKIIFKAIKIILSVNNLYEYISGLEFQNVRQLLDFVMRVVDQYRRLKMEVHDLMKLVKEEFEIWKTAFMNNFKTYQESKNFGTFNKLLETRCFYILIFIQEEVNYKTILIFNKQTAECFNTTVQYE